MREAWVRQLSGVNLKDEAQIPLLEGGNGAGPGNFLCGPGKDQQA
jgi:ethanolamine ammonia-lyase small subunit